MDRNWEHRQKHYDRIAMSIDYIVEHFQRQPDLDEIAAAVHLSPFHFQRLFSEWAGVSPKKFIQYLSLEYAKGLLQNRSMDLQEVAQNTGLSGSGRLHDLFVNIERMTPGEYKNGGTALQLRYSFALSPFGKIMLASTDRGVCSIAFDENEDQALVGLKKKFPNANFLAKTDASQLNALRIFQLDWSNLDTVRVHLKGTPFQIKVWESLLKIPFGTLASYAEVAAAIGQPRASRAVGTANAKNPIAFLIPCHRVIQSSGHISGFGWGPTRKRAMIAWEAARAKNDWPPRK